MSRCLFGFLVWVMVVCSAHGGTLAVFHTSKGDIEVELFDREKPITVANFIRYVEQVYPTNNVILHRCLPGFVLQGGGYGVTNRSSTNYFDYVSSVYRFPAIPNEFNVGPLRSNVVGTIAMAKRGGDPNSASAEWFFNLANNSANLDNQNGGFTVFGQVVGGMDVLQSFNSLYKIVDNVSCLFRGIADLSCYRLDAFGDLFSDLPVNYVLTRYPRYNELFFVDIAVLKLRVVPQLSGARELRWKSIKGRVNILEASEGADQGWTALKTATGDGAEQVYIDSGTSSTSRLYRVRVGY